MRRIINPEYAKVTNPTVRLMTDDPNCYRVLNIGPKPDMNKPEINRLIIGGPKNGEYAHWLGDIVELPGDHVYRRKKLTIDEAQIYIYIYDKLTDIEALELLRTGYLEIS